jgi:protein arginine N-methyltransferase 1
MLKDTVRTKSYMKSIIDNPELFKDKIVLDVGSGTAILSIFAAKSGAKHVYGIEKANIYSHSRNIIEENGLSDKITIINGLVE